MLKLIKTIPLKRQFVFVFVCFFCSNLTIGQDFVFSQFYNAPLQLNPAFAGNTSYPNFAINYRNQWPSLNSSYVTYAASYDQFFNKLNSGFGLWFSNDVQGEGVLEQIDFRGIYSYKMKFQHDWQLKIGLEVGYRQTKLDWDQLIFFDQLDKIQGVSIPQSTEIRPDVLSKGNVDVSTGFLLYNPKLYAGFTFRHLTNPYVGFGSNPEDTDQFGLPVYLSAHAGYQITIVKGNKQFGGTFISPNVLFAKQGDFSQINLGAYMQIRSLFGGAWFRHTFGNIDALIFSFGFDTGYLKMGYSFDLTTSTLGLSTGGSHELGILIRLSDLAPEESEINDCLQLFR